MAISKKEYDLELAKRDQTIAQMAQALHDEQAAHKKTGERVAELMHNNQLLQQTLAEMTQNVLILTKAIGRVMP